MYGRASTAETGACSLLISIPCSASVRRRDLILAAGSADELIEVMEDLSQLKVVPLLQATLFDDDQ